LLLIRSVMAVYEKQSTLLDVNVSEDISASIFKVESGFLISATGQDGGRTHLLHSSIC
jgi:hypothetical protein